MTAADVSTMPRVVSAADAATRNIALIVALALFGWIAITELLDVFST